MAITSRRVHRNYVATTGLRADEGKDEVKSVDASKWNKQKGRFYSFDKGHLVLLTKWADPSNRPLALRRDELAAQHDAAKADWMIGCLRTLCLYSNLFLMDEVSSQRRVFHPILVDQTEVTISWIAPKGETQGARTEDESLFVVRHSQWSARMAAAVEA